MLLLIINNNTVLSFTNVKEFKLIKSYVFDKKEILCVLFNDETPNFTCHLQGNYKVDCEG